jgi:hypothetical protein
VFSKQNAHADGDKPESDTPHLFFLAPLSFSLCWKRTKSQNNDWDFKDRDPDSRSPDEVSYKPYLKLGAEVTASNNFVGPVPAPAALGDDSERLSNVIR